MTSPSVAVVIPNHLPHLDFLSEWGELCQRDVAVIVMQDGDADAAREARASVVVADADGPQVVVYSHEDVDRELLGDHWIIPQRTSACRSFGILKAWQTGAKVIATLDNDCFPYLPADGRRSAYPWWQHHEINLTCGRTLDWVPSWQTASRGFPYTNRRTSETWLSHGLWTGTPDFDAIDEFSAMPARRHFAMPNDLLFGTKTIPRWSFFPMCGMNLAWRRELTPAMWFGLFGPDYGFDQYDDIWCGILAKKVLDVLGKAAVSGAPMVEHRRQSSPFANLRKQAPGLEVNEHFWRAVQRVPIPEWAAREDLDVLPAAAVYQALISALPDRIEGDEHLPDGYFATFKEGALLWASRFDG